MALKTSNKCPHVFFAEGGERVEDFILPGGWYWWDEAGLLGTKYPHKTEDDAIQELNKYANDLLSSL